MSPKPGRQRAQSGVFAVDLLARTWRPLQHVERCAGAPDPDARGFGVLATDRGARPGFAEPALAVGRHELDVLSRAMRKADRRKRIREDRAAKATPHGQPIVLGAER